MAVYLIRAIQNIRYVEQLKFKYWNGFEWIDLEESYINYQFLIAELSGNMSYEETTIKDLYRHTVNNMVIDAAPEGNFDELVRAAAWVTAENFFEVRAIISKWFNMLQDGIANSQYPDPFNNKITQEKADWMIAEIDDDINKESNRFPEKGKGPDYFRLKPHSRLAMAQEIYNILKGKQAIIEEAKRRLALGEKIPPEGVPTIIYYSSGGV